MMPRYFSTFLKDRHKDFLNLVKDHGKGYINVRRHKDNNKIIEVVFNNTEKKNCISGAMMYQLAEAVEKIDGEVKKDDSLICLSIRGEGDEIFSSGADLSLAKEILNSPEKGLMMSHFMTDILNYIRYCPLISVCCVNGSAIGGGAELTTVADYRLMSDNPNHYIQFVHAKIGASTGWGGTNRLVSIVGRKQALKLLGTSSRLKLSEAISIGYIDNTFPSSKLDWQAATEAFLQPFLLQKFSSAVKTAKTNVAACDRSLEMGLSIESDNFAKRWFSSEHSVYMDSLSPKK